MAVEMKILVEDSGTSAPAPSSRNAREQGKRVRHFIVSNLDKHPKDIGVIAANKFGITRQAINKHLSRLIEEGTVLASGKTKTRTYTLAPLQRKDEYYAITAELAEHDIWDKDISPKLQSVVLKNSLDIWQFCFTEMFNNAIDHSGGTNISVSLVITLANTQILISDNGVGIFKKIQTSMGLLDQRHAVLELSKGKLTTDPSKHSGQGIFFTSRLLDSFDILSGGVFFTHSFDQEEDWIIERPESTAGTAIFMKLSNDSSRIDEEVFKNYSSVDGYAFTKTVVPVRLAQYGDEKLISRSQAKRLLARVDQFETVLLDFSGVDSIGQAFTDEIFRVFARSHPTMKILAMNTNERITAIIDAAKSDWQPVNALASPPR